MASLLPRSSRWDSVQNRIDNVNLIDKPLDFSFQQISNLADLPNHEPAGGPRNMSMNANASDAKQNVIVRAAQLRPVVTGVRLCHNNIKTLDGLVEALRAVMDNPARNLQWLDLSYNELSKIGDQLLAFPNLTTLYLHGNQIRSLNEVKKLNALTNLQKLTLHGNEWEVQDKNVAALQKAAQEKAKAANEGGVGATSDSGAGSGDKPSGSGEEEKGGSAAGGADAGLQPSSGFIIGPDGAIIHVQKKRKSLEATKFYREQIIWHLRDTSLKSLDFASVTPKDRQAAVVWKNIRGRSRERKQNNADDGQG